MSIDWSLPMQQEYEYWRVDENTWTDKEKLLSVKSSNTTIKWDFTTSTMVSATIDTLDVSEEYYVRIYLVAKQGNEGAKEPLGTILIQTTDKKMSSTLVSKSSSGYSPLKELSSRYPTTGYTLLKNANVLFNAYQIVNANVRAPVIQLESDDILYDDYVAELNKSWLDYISDLLTSKDYYIAVNTIGNIYFAESKKLKSLPVQWVYTDDNSSIIQPDISDKVDLTDIPNRLTVVYSKDSGYIVSTVENNDSDSPLSIANRGRIVESIITDVNISGTINQSILDDYAKSQLKSASTIQHTVTYTHAWCPVYVGEAVVINNSRFGYSGVKARVQAQDISCKPGCPVSETAVWYEELWSGEDDS